LSHQRGKNPNKTKGKKPTKCPMFKCNTLSVLIILVLVPQPSNPGDAVSEVVLSLSHQRGKKPNKTKQKKKTP
jgi:hypothetical protein